MARYGTTLFQTRIGNCGIAWQDDLVVGVELPHFSPMETLKALENRFPSSKESKPTGNSLRAKRAIINLLAGKPETFKDIKVNLDSSSKFDQEILRETRGIRRGETVTYSELAWRVGKPGAARAVGSGLGRNPCPIIVPCHRVLATQGSGGGFSAMGGLTTKFTLLQVEGHDIGFPGFDYSPVDAMKFLLQRDPRFKEVIQVVGWPKIAIEPRRSVYGSLVRAIVSQQLSVKAAGTIFSRVLKVVSGRKSDFSPLEFQQVTDRALREAGLSRNKLLALRDLSEKMLEGVIPSEAKLKRLDDQAIVDILTQVRGIGRWTVEIMLIFRLGRADVVAADDLGLRQGYAAISGGREAVTRDTLVRAANRWMPYRSLACWYLWRAADLARSKR